MSTQTASKSIFSISNLTASTCTFMVIQSFSQLYRHSHGLYNNLKDLVNPYPKWKEKNAFRDLEDAFRVPESANRGRVCWSRP